MAARLCKFNVKSVHKFSSLFINGKYFSKDSWVPVEKKTHTGQAWEEDDYRLARYINKSKEVNTRFAIDLINSVPPAPKKNRVVWCDGGGGPTGHPKVFINLDKPGNHACGYCGLRFFKEDHEHH